MKAYIHNLPFKPTDTENIQFVSSSKEADFDVFINSTHFQRGVHFSTTPSSDSKFITSPKNKTVVLLPQTYPVEEIVKTISGTAAKVDNKDLSKFKYCVHEEPINSINHWTHSKAILNECFVFYKGCPNLEHILPPDSFVRFTSQDNLIQLLERATQEDWWGQSIESIRRAKQIILEKYTISSYVERVTKHEFILQTVFQNRFDFYAKICYAKRPLSTYAREVYKDQINVFINGYEKDEGQFEVSKKTNVKKNFDDVLSK